MNKEHKCRLCGKCFITPSKLAAHQNKKTPCVIQHITDEMLNDPNRCIYCNNIYASKASLCHHYRICKRKIERDKNHHVGAEIRNKIDLDKFKIETEKQILELKLENEKKTLEIKNLLEAIVKSREDNNTQVTNNINNTVNAENVNITLNNYNQPTIPDISYEDIRNCNGFHRLLFEMIYFNPKLPENHVIISQNDGRRNHKDRCLRLHKDGWEKLVGDELTTELIAIKNTVINLGLSILLSNGKKYQEEHIAKNKPVEFKTRIDNFRAREEIVEPNEIFEMAVRYSPIVCKHND